MSKERQLLERALNSANCGYELPPSLKKDIKALLEEPEAEPVGVFTGKFHQVGDNIVIEVKCFGAIPRVMDKLYTDQPRKPEADPIGYIAGYAARIIRNGGTWDSFSFTREKCDESDDGVYLHPPLQPVQLSDDDLSIIKSAVDDLEELLIELRRGRKAVTDARAVIAAYEEKQNGR